MNNIEKASKIARLCQYMHSSAIQHFVSGKWSDVGDAIINGGRIEVFLGGIWHGVQHDSIGGLMEDYRVEHSLSRLHDGGNLHNVVELKARFVVGDIEFSRTVDYEAYQHLRNGFIESVTLLEEIGIVEINVVYNNSNVLVPIIAHDFEAPEELINRLKLLKPSDIEVIA